MQEVRNLAEPDIPFHSKPCNPRHMKQNDSIHDQKKIRKSFFPHKLLQMLSSPDLEDSISWADDGKGFVLMDRHKFSKHFTKVHTLQVSARFMKSFVRKLNRWGFKMNVKRGPKYGIYSHKYFNKNTPKLCEMMTCDNRSHFSKTLSTMKDIPDASDLRKKEKMDVFGSGSEDKKIWPKKNNVGQVGFNLGSQIEYIMSIERKIKLIDKLIIEKINRARL